MRTSGERGHRWEDKIKTDCVDGGLDTSGCVEFQN